MQEKREAQLLAHCCQQTYPQRKDQQLKLAEM